MCHAWLYTIFNNYNIIKVHREFNLLLDAEKSVNSLMDEWSEWKGKIISLSKLESRNRSTIRKTLAVLEKENHDKSEG